MIELYEYVLDSDELRGPGWLQVSAEDIVDAYNRGELDMLAIELEDGQYARLRYLPECTRFNLYNELNLSGLRKRSYQNKVHGLASQICTLEGKLAKLREEHRLTEEAYLAFLKEELQR